MSWLRVLASRIRGLFSKRRLERELDEELRANIEMATEENLRRGISAEEARYAARREFGGVEQTKEIYREHGGLIFIETLFQDIRYASRMMRHNRAFTEVAVGSRTVCVFKTHYREPRVETLQFMPNQCDRNFVRYAVFGAGRATDFLGLATLGSLTRGPRRCRAR